MKNQKRYFFIALDFFSIVLTEALALGLSFFMLEHLSVQQSLQDTISQQENLL